MLPIMIYAQYILSKKSDIGENECACITDKMYIKVLEVIDVQKSTDVWEALKECPLMQTFLSNFIFCLYLFQWDTIA